MFDHQSPFVIKTPPDLAELAEQRLVGDILSGKLLPGQRLSEQALCQEYRFGRGIMRGVLGRLAHRGFVSSQSRSGWKVASITAVGLREITLARRQMEPLLAHVDISHQDIERLEVICDMQAAIASHPSLSIDQISLLRRYEREIRDLLANGLRAPLIAGWLGNLWDRSEFYLNFLETAAPAKLKPADWNVYVDAKKAGRVKDAAAFIRKTGEAFAAYTQAQLLQSDLSLSIAPQPRKRATARDGRSPQNPGVAPSTSKRTP